MRYVFSVLPGGASFAASESGGPDTNNAYFHAHLCAARQAAEHKITSWVVRNDTGEERYGFGRTAFLTPTTVLYQIMQMALASYWDDAQNAWVPLPAEEAETKVALEAV